MDYDWMNILIGGVAVAPVIVLLINWLKDQGMPPQYASWLCGGLAVVAFIASAFLIPAYPFLEVYAKGIVGSLIVFLAATTQYKITKPSDATVKASAKAK